MLRWRTIPSRSARVWPRLLGPSLLLSLLLPLLLFAGSAGAMGVGSDTAPSGAGSDAGSAPLAGETAPGPMSPGQAVFGEVLVRFRADVEAERRDALLAELEKRVKQSLGGQNAYVVALPAGMRVADAIARLQALPEVAAAEPNRITPREPRPGRPRTPLAPR